MPPNVIFISLSIKLSMARYQIRIDLQQTDRSQSERRLSNFQAAQNFHLHFVPWTKGIY